MRHDCATLTEYSYFLFIDIRYANKRDRIINASCCTDCTMHTTNTGPGPTKLKVAYSSLQVGLYIVDQSIVEPASAPSRYRHCQNHDNHGKRPERLGPNIFH